MPRMKWWIWPEASKSIKPLAERPSHLKQLVPGEEKDEHEQSTRRAVLVVKKESVPLGARSSPDVKMDGSSYHALTRKACCESSNCVCQHDMLLLLTSMI